MARKKLFNIKKEKRNQWQRGCQVKSRYRTKRLAILQISRLVSRPGIKPYRCEFCGWWHIGHAYKSSTQGYSSVVEQSSDKR